VNDLKSLMNKGVEDFIVLKYELHYKGGLEWTIYYLKQHIKACYINLLNNRKGL
jgi:hypothetical protein